jgi:hypothetical protein
MGRRVANGIVDSILAKPGAAIALVAVEQTVLLHGHRRHEMAMRTASRNRSANDAAHAVEE